MALLNHSTQCSRGPGTWKTVAQARTKIDLDRIIVRWSSRDSEAELDLPSGLLFDSESYKTETRQIDGNDVVQHEPSLVVFKLTQKERKTFYCIRRSFKTLRRWRSLFFHYQRLRQGPRIHT